MVQQFNDRYKNKSGHGWKVKVDERILWVWACDLPVGGHKVDIKPGGFGPEYKFLSAVGVQVTNTFEHVISKKVKYESTYTKEYGVCASCVLHLCESYWYRRQKPCCGCI